MTPGAKSQPSLHVDVDKFLLNNPRLGDMFVLLRGCYCTLMTSSGYDGTQWLDRGDTLLYLGSERIEEENRVDVSMHHHFLSSMLNHLVYVWRFVRPEEL